MSTPESEIPDLKSLLVEHASRPTSSVTVPLAQADAELIRRLEAELADIAADAKSKRMGAASPLKAKAQEIEAARAHMTASLVTFRFEAMTPEARDQIRKDMAGRDEPDERDLRILAAMCVSPKATWEDFRDMRETLGVAVFDDLDQASNRAAGVPDVPFSSAASHILGTAK